MKKDSQYHRQNSYKTAVTPRQKRLQLPICLFHRKIVSHYGENSL